MKVFIGCSSSDLINKKYFEACESLLNKMFKEDYDLVFGASTTGLMGLSYDIAKKHGKKIIATAPKVYEEDLKILECDEEILTPNISLRTEVLIDECDVILYLPGGVGTVYEFMSTLEFKRSGEFDKPIIIYNYDGFFNDMLNMLNKIYQENFTDEIVKKAYIVSENIDEIIELLKRG